MLKVNNVSASYGKVTVLWDVSISVAENETVALVGANAAGKTTILRTISGFIATLSGTLEFRGQKIDGIPPYRRAGLGISHVPEGGKLFPDMTVLENLEMGAYVNETWKRKDETLTKVYQLFPILEAKSKQLAHTLSGGERQMVAMGRSLMSRPRLMMFDEPSYGLAPIVVKELFQFIKELQSQGMTILVVEQNIRHALEVAARGYVLENGRIVIQGESAALLDDEHIRKAYLGL